MDRLKFLHALDLVPLAGVTMKLRELDKIFSPKNSTDKMPVLFLGHGSPMNAIEENEFVNGFRETAIKLPAPTAILCVSAHWETKGTFVTAMENPRTIHDFGGFPKALFDVQYPAAGSPEMAAETKKIIQKTEIGLDHHWGLDHGAWSVIKHLYPKANVPVIQLSLDYTKPSQYHYDLARELSALRRKGVLIVGSGNMVHNLGMVAWDKLNVSGFGFDWAIEASEKMKQMILNGDHLGLTNYNNQGRSFQLAVPTPEHYLPLLYTLALQEKNDDISLFNDKAIAGSLTMTSVLIDQK